MVNRALVISHNVATASVLMTHVTSELEIRINFAHVRRTKARVRDYDQHLWIAVRKTALPYTIW